VFAESVIHLIFIPFQFVAIEDGGEGFDTKNMFLQTPAASRKKDLAENFIHRQICSGKMTAADGQKALATNWKGIKIK